MEVKYLDGKGIFVSQLIPSSASHIFMPERLRIQLWWWS